MDEEGSTGLDLWNDLDARGAVPYDGDAFVGVVKVLWPGGAVDDAALEVVEAVDVGPFPVAR